MTFTWSVHASEDPVHDTNWCVMSDAPPRDTIAKANAAVGICRRLECANDGCPNSNDTPTLRFYEIDC
jgi:hypothetical protein